MTIMLTLPPQEEAKLIDAAAAEGLSVDAFVRAALDHALADQNELPIEEGPRPAPGARPIWEVITENMKNIPPEDFERLPKDGASQVDHYLYGSPKRY